MKIDLRQGMKLCTLLAFVSAAHACAHADVLHVQEPHLQKAANLSQIACTIYPSMRDAEACMDKVIQKILADRDVAQEERAAIIREQAVQNHALVTRLEKVIRMACAQPPVIRDVNACMDKVYHSILSSRDPNSAYLNQAEAEKFRRLMRNERLPSRPSSGSDAAAEISMVSTDILVAPNDPNSKFGYVKLTLFGRNLRKIMILAVKELYRKHPDMKGIVFDVRGNPGGWLDEAYEAVDAFTDSPLPFLSIRDKDGIHAYGTIPGFLVREPQPGDILNGLPVGVLVDGDSISASELFAAALKKLDRSVTIGKRTWRKGTIQEHIDQSDGSMIKKTVGEYLIGSSANWIAVQCVGVVPDIDYEAKSAVMSKKARHECELDGAIAPGGRSSDPNSIEVPLRERDPLRYAIGLEMTEAVKAFDNKKSATK